jgi:thiamine pyrophosphokinase
MTVHGALGGPRLDHLLGMIGLLTADWLAGLDVRLVDDHQEIYLAGGDRMIEGSAGDTVSLLPLTPVVEDVHTDGLLYPLRGEVLLQGAVRGVSNEMIGRRAHVSHGAGHLLIVHFHGGTHPGNAARGEE